MSLFRLGDFTLNSGARSRWKLECDALTPADIEALAEMIRQTVGPFCSVDGVPRGGLALAKALRPLASVSGPHLIVDDVLTTGGSMERAKARYAAAGTDTFPRQDAITGAVVFARGKCPPWVKTLFQMPECLWLPRTS